MFCGIKKSRSFVSTIKVNDMKSLNSVKNFFEAEALMINKVLQDFDLDGYSMRKQAGENMDKQLVNFKANYYSKVLSYKLLLPKSVANCQYANNFFAKPKPLTYYCLPNK